MRNKKGFVTVYLCMFFVGLVTLTSLFTASAKEGAAVGGVEALGRLWSQSILAEYDLNLQQRYGLFGYYGSSALVKDKLDFYLSTSLPHLPNRRVTTGNCSLYDYSLRNVEVFQKQVVEIGKLAATGKKNAPKGDISSTTHHTAASKAQLFQNLPSEGAKSGLAIVSIAETVKTKKSFKELIKSGTNGWFEIEYLFFHFKHFGQEEELGESYFEQEVEYVIGGKTSDAANEKVVKNRIIALREVLNLAYLNGDEVSRNAALAAAELLTPGPAAVATQQTLLGLWAYAESVNDYRLLREGRPVPLQKSPEYWAVDLDSVIDNTAENYIDTGCEEGDTYEDYLQLFLRCMNGKTRLLRIMDLIQLNMRYFYYDGFLLEDYYGGVAFDLIVDGEVLSFEDTY